MKNSVLIIATLLISNFIFGQNGSLTLKVDKDTVYQDEVIKVEYLLDNLTGNFRAPDFEGFKIVSGPNTSSSYSMINGEVSQKKSYSYNLIPQSFGLQQIGQATVEHDDGIISTKPLDIMVLSSENLKADHKSRKRTYIYGHESETKTNEKKTNPKRVMKKI